MIAIINKSDCCGCNACGDVCPKHCISFQTDIEGFWYPEVNGSACVDCHRCEQVCPVINADALRHNDLEQPECYAAEHRNMEVVFDSTSGGLFSALADEMYTRDGFVGGAVFNADFSVSHFISDDKADLPRLRSSKYLESNAEGFYLRVKELCDAGKPALVCGTPCQMAALRAFLGRDYPRLVIADFICRGVSSPKVWRKYLDTFEERYGSPVVYAKAKSKEYGWRNLTQKVTLANGKSYYETRYTNRSGKLYLDTNVTCRPSCYECHFKEFPRLADITLADFWGIEKYDQSMEKNIGTSLVMVNSQKGKAYFEETKKRIRCMPMPFESILGGNPMLVQPIAPPKVDREAFFRDLDALTFTQTYEKYCAALPDGPGGIRSLLRPLYRHMKAAYRFLRWHRFNIFAVAGALRINRRAHNPAGNVLRGNMIMPHTHTVVDISRSARVLLGGRLFVGGKKFARSRWETRLLVDGGACLQVDGDYGFGYGSDVEVFRGGTLHIKGRSEGVQTVPGANCGLTLICAEKVEIGHDVMMGRNVTIRDNNGGHYLNLPGYRNSRPVIIGDKAWLCERCVIMPGAKIGDGAVVGACSVVYGNVPAHTMVSGNPARVVEENVLWKY